ncbi:stage II sporulation protein P [Solibacillus sp. FSL K6-1554]|uniref:stage II sporulation protein P n=1 Tax=Solibacillus sp. FSL K6-1554 TaxID=2921472 RepID=UPI0030FBC1E4
MSFTIVRYSKEEWRFILYLCQIFREFANHLHQKLEKLYPGISRGVIEQGENPRNTYNQEIQKQSVLLNIGGTENTMEEAFRATDALAEAIKEIVQEP